MFWEQIAATWGRFAAKPEAAMQAAPNCDNLVLSTASVDDVQEDPTPRPYIPANSEKLNEASLHFSC